MYKFIFLVLRGIGLMSRVFANGPGDQGSVPGRVIPKTQKTVLDTICLTLSTIIQGSRVKRSNPGKGVAPSPTLRCSSYWKGSLRVALDYVRHLYLFTNRMWLPYYFCSHRIYVGSINIQGTYVAALLFLITQYMYTYICVCNESQYTWDPCDYPIFSAHSVYIYYIYTINFNTDFSFS